MVGVDVVTAEGEELHCSIAENEDLFWLARGGGPGISPCPDWMIIGLPII